MTQSLKLPKDLDLHTEGDRCLLLEAVRAQPETGLTADTEFERGIENLARLFPDASWLTLHKYSPESLPVRTGMRKTSYFPLDRAVALGLVLKNLEKCERFEEFTQGFHNPTAFFDTVFEAHVANYCLSKGFALRFSPGYSVRGRLKHPDFEIDTQIGTLVCECKSGHEADYRYVQALSNFASALDDAAKQAGGVPDSRRLEVHITGPIRADWKKLAEEITQRVLVTDKLPSDQVVIVGPCSVAMPMRESPPAFTWSGLVSVRVVVGATPVGITEEYQHLRVSSSRLHKKQVKAAGSLITDALSQLPTEKWGVIFLEIMSGNVGVDAAKRRLGTQEYDHIFTCGVYSSPGLQFVSRTLRHPQVSAIFWPFEEKAIS